MVAVFVAVLSQFISDVGYTFLNPRIRFAEGCHDRLTTAPTAASAAPAAPRLGRLLASIALLRESPSG